MATDSERLEAAADKAENASDIAYNWANGLEGEFVETENGDIPTLAEFMRQKGELVTEYLESLGATGSFTSADGKTITVTQGLITDIS